MPPQLTIGKFQPVKSAIPGVGGTGFQAFGQPGYQNPYLTSGYTKPGAQYGGVYGQYQPTIGDQKSTTPAGSVPTIQLPQGTAATPAFTPDYGSMIGGSWEVEAAESAMASQMAAARAAFQSNLRQSFIDLGYSGDMTKDNGLGDFSKYIDKATIQKAIDNKYSAYSTIKQQEAKANAYNDALLASSGLDVSGTAGSTATDTINKAEQARYEGLRNFLSGGQQGLQGLTQLKAQLAAQVAQARAAAAARLAQMYPPTAGTPAQPVNWDDYWNSYQGGTFAMPGQGNGWIVQSGVPNPETGGPAPYWVGPGSGGIGDLSWMYDKGWKPEVTNAWGSVPDYNKYW